MLSNISAWFLSMPSRVSGDTPGSGVGPAPYGVPVAPGFPDLYPPMHPAVPLFAAAGAIPADPWELGGDAGDCDALLTRAQDGLAAAAVGATAEAVLAQLQEAATTLRVATSLARRLGYDVTVQREEAARTGAVRAASGLLAAAGNFRAEHAPEAGESAYPVVMPVVQTTPSDASGGAAMPLWEPHHVQQLDYLLQDFAQHLQTVPAKCALRDAYALVGQSFAAAAWAKPNADSPALVALLTAQAKTYAELAGRSGLV